MKLKGKRRICDYCGIEYEGYPGKPKGVHHFCGKECRCKWLGEQNRSKRVNQPGGLTFEERGKIREAALRRVGAANSNTYKKFHGRHIHRIVAEEKIGRSLAPGEVVHHIDEDKHNNHPDNLMVFKNQAEHALWHASLRKEVVQ